MQDFGLQISLPTDTLLQVGFLVMLAVYIVYTVILHYHWRQYTADSRMTIITFIIYAIATLPLLAVMGLIAVTA